MLGTRRGVHDGQQNESDGIGNAANIQGHIERGRQNHVADKCKANLAHLVHCYAIGQGIFLSLP